MNKKIFGGIAILAIAVAVAFNVSVSNQKQDAISMLALANVEALASEGAVNPNICYNCKLVDFKNNKGIIYKSCCESGYQQGSECDYRSQVNC